MNNKRFKYTNDNYYDFINDDLINIILFLIVITLIICSFFQKEKFMEIDHQIDHQINQNENKKEKEKEKEKEYKDIIIVFDIDNTLTCNIQNARKAVLFAKARNIRLAISTARAVPYTGDLNLIDLSLDHTDFINDFYTCTRNDHLFENNTQALTINIANQKLDHLLIIQKKYSIDNRKKIILIDDNIYNITVANNNGFSVIHANAIPCGINDNIEEELYGILRGI